VVLNKFIEKNQIETKKERVITNKGIELSNNSRSINSFHLTTTLTKKSQISDFF
jgi:hypothetical protein